ncbi:MAG TPA: hypothetical protein VET85_07785, partial [Stellaceae bacterium]|nr:hypothetical protein [Stellaceae bacterium]
MNGISKRGTSRSRRRRVAATLWSRGGRCCSPPLREIRFTPFRQAAGKSVHYISTRDGRTRPERLAFDDVLLAGLARDGGLYLPEA